MSAAVQVDTLVEVWAAHKSLVVSLAADSRSAVKVEQTRMVEPAGRDPWR